MPPVDGESPRRRVPVREHWTSRRADDAPSGCVILTGTLDDATSARIGGLADAFDAANVRVAVMPVGVAGDAARDASLVLLAGVADAGAVEPVLARRTESGRPTVLDVGAGMVELATSGPRLTDGAAGLAAACGAAVAPGGARFAAARAAAPRTLQLPTLLTREHVLALRDARERAVPGTPLVVGWRLDATTPADYVEAVAEGIAAYLVEPGHRDGVRIELVGAQAAVPASISEHSRITVVDAGALTPAALASWSLHVWTPARLGDTIVDDARLLEEASCAGVATVMPAAVLPGVDGVVSPHVLVEDPTSPAGWLNGLHHVLDDDHVRAGRSREAARRADALNALGVARALVTRLCGWAGYRAGAEAVA
jgi:hypothetical protein